MRTQLQTIPNHVTNAKMHQTNNEPPTLNKQIISRKCIGNLICIQRVALTANILGMFVVFFSVRNVTARYRAMNRIWFKLFSARLECANRTKVPTSYRFFASTVDARRISNANVASQLWRWPTALRSMVTLKYTILSISFRVRWCRFETDEPNHQTIPSSTVTATRTTCIYLI